MAEQVGNGRPTESGIFRTGNSYRAIARPSGWTGDAAPFPVYVWGNGTPMTLLGAFAQFNFTDFSREYFMLKAGTADTLTLSPAGQQYYVGCDGLEIVFEADGSVTVTITGMQYSYFDTYDAVLRITQIGGTVALGGSAEELRQAAEEYDAWKNGESAALAEGTYQAAMRITNDVYTSGSNPMPLVHEESVFDFADGTATLDSGNIVYTFAYEKSGGGYVLTDTGGTFSAATRLTVKYIGGKLYFGGEYYREDGIVLCETLYVFTAE